jgi:hypothetical protein
MTGEAKGAKRPSSCDCPEADVRRFAKRERFNEAEA